MGDCVEWMMSDSTTRWNVSVSKDTDNALRRFLAQRGMKKGDLSKFVEDAVKWRVFEHTLAEARSKFADMSAGSIESLVDEAVSVTRREHIRASG